MIIITCGSPRFFFIIACGAFLLSASCALDVVGSPHIRLVINVMITAASQVVECAPSSDSPHNLLELRSGRRLCQLSASMSQDAPTSTSTSTISASTTPASPYWFVSGHRRDRHLFAWLRGEDVEDWLDDYDRVSSANRWDDPSKLHHVAFYLTGVAKTWFFNHEVDFTDWGTFTQQLRQIFGTPAVRSALAKKTLDTRK